MSSAIQMNPMNKSINFAGMTALPAPRQTKKYSTASTGRMDMVDGHQRRREREKKRLCQVGEAVSIFSSILALSWGFSRAICVQGTFPIFKLFVCNQVPNKIDISFHCTRLTLSQVFPRAICFSRAICVQSFKVSRAICVQGFQFSNCLCVTRCRILIHLD